MSPPAEQLIRDYLNRLSVAARGQLGHEDRRALVSRTRDFIERKTGFAGPPTAVEVAQLLAGLGDPARLVSQERQRLAALRGETAEPASRGWLARTLLGDPGRVRGASWHWPVQEGSRADLQLTLLGHGVPGVAAPETDGSANGGRKSGGLAPANGTAALVPARSADPAPSADPEGSPDPARSADPEGSPDPAPSADPEGPADPQGSAVAQPDGDRGSILPGLRVRPASTARKSRQRAAPAGSLLTLALRLLAKVAGWSRRNKLEAVAVVLLGLGGVIFPPVWLLGAMVALASRLWDYRDKWLGLALPVVLTVTGAAAGVAAGGRGATLGQHVHDGWMFAVVISRVVAVLSASYLAWRSVHGRRPPATPPWSKPHKAG